MDKVFQMFKSTFPYGFIAILFFIVAFGCNESANTSDATVSDQASSQNAQANRDMNDEFENGEVRDFKKLNEYSGTTRLTLAATTKRLRDLERVELTNFTRGESVVVPNEIGSKILSLILKSPLGMPETEDDKHFTTSLSVYEMRFFVGKKSYMELTFYQDLSVWIAGDEGSEQRDISGQAKKIHDLLEGFDFQLPSADEQSIGLSDISKVEMLTIQNRREVWRDVDLRLGKEIIKTVVDCPILVHSDDFSLTEREVKTRQFSFRFLIDIETYLFVEVFEGYSWFVYDAPNAVKQDTKAQAHVIGELIGKTKAVHETGRSTKRGLRQEAWRRRMMTM